MTGTTSDNDSPANVIIGGTFNGPVAQQADDDTGDPANVIIGGTFNGPVVQVRGLTR